MESYSFSEHKHRYAVWTAARASQRAFTSTKNIKNAIEKSSLRAFAESNAELNDTEFEIFHRKCSKDIIIALRALDVEKATYGRAAKIIAIYLKTSVIMTNNASCLRSLIVHPPIDNILLTNLSVKNGLKAIKNVKWTHLDEKQYWSLVILIKSQVNCFDWTLESFWDSATEL